MGIATGSVTAPVVWRLAEGDAPGAAALLARAFVDEPLLQADFPDPAARVRYFAARWAGSVRFACRFGGALGVGATPGDLAGVAIWTREPAPPPTDELRAELGYPPPDPVADAAMERVAAMMAEADAELHAGMGLGPDLTSLWRYLALIGIDPGRQRQGFGAALLRRLLADAEAAGEAVGLITTVPANVPFYERAGLEVVWGGTTAGGTIPVWCLRSGRAEATAGVDAAGGGR